MDYIREEIHNQVSDKLDNMEYSEITEELYKWLQGKEEVIEKAVYEVLTNNEIVNTNTKIKAKDGFSKVLIMNWEHIEKLQGKERKREIQSTILYNYDALWMTAIHKAFPNETTNTQYGYGEMDLVK